MFEKREGSETGHCCFNWSIVDTDKPQRNGDGDIMEDCYDTVCECFDEANCDMILSLLNT